MFGDVERVGLLAPLDVVRKISTSRATAWAVPISWWGLHARERARERTHTHRGRGDGWRDKINTGRLKVQVVPFETSVLGFFLIDSLHVHTRSAPATLSRTVSCSRPCMRDRLISWLKTLSTSPACPNLTRSSRRWALTLAQQHGSKQERRGPRDSREHIEFRACLAQNTEQTEDAGGRDGGAGGGRNESESAPRRPRSLLPANARHT